MMHTRDFLALGREKRARRRRGRTDVSSRDWRYNRDTRSFRFVLYFLRRTANGVSSQREKSKEEINRAGCYQGVSVLLARPLTCRAALITATSVARDLPWPHASRDHYTDAEQCTASSLLLSCCTDTVHRSVNEQAYWPTVTFSV